MEKKVNVITESPESSGDLSSPIIYDFTEINKVNESLYEFIHGYKPKCPEWEILSTASEGGIGAIHDKETYIKLNSDLSKRLEVIEVPEDFPFEAKHLKLHHGHIPYMTALGLALLITRRVSIADSGIKSIVYDDTVIVLDKGVMDDVLDLYPDAAIQSFMRL